MIMKLFQNTSLKEHLVTSIKVITLLLVNIHMNIGATILNIGSLLQN
jgi:hypothetical protein